MSTSNSQIMSLLKQLASEYLFSPSKEIWRQHVRAFHYFPILCTLMSVIQTPAGKTSIVKSLFNIPGKLSWITMELASPISFLITLFLNVPISQISSTIASLPYTHIILTLCYLTHYTHRAIISPLRAPNISPNHVIVWLIGVLFNYFNGYSLGGFLLLNFSDVDVSTTVAKGRFWFGVVVWGLGLWGNVWHENVLYDIRRRTMRYKEKVGRMKKGDVTEEHNGVANGNNGDVKDGKEEEKPLRVTAENGQVYEVPVGGLYRWTWHPHYFVEWIEWTGFLIATGGAAPAVNFLINEIACMAPRALQGKYWYKKKFGRKTPDKAAVVPFVL